MQIDLTHKVALVTGAGEGIGRGIALALAAAGATVIVNDCNPQTGVATATFIGERGGQAHFMQADVSNLDSVVAMMTAIQQQCGALHLLVNNAGFNLLRVLPTPHRVSGTRFSRWTCAACTL